MAKQNPFLLEPEADDGSAPDILPSSGLVTPAKTFKTQNVISIGRISFDLTKGNPLIVAAAQLLSLVDYLVREPEEFGHLSICRRKIDDALTDFASKVEDLERSNLDLIAQASAILSALVEDIALNGRLPGAREWMEAGSLVAPFPIAEDKNFVFDLLNDSKQDPFHHVALLELLYLALALGYEGPLRDDPTGPIRLTQYREHLLGLVRNNNARHPLQTSFMRANQANSGRGLSLITPVNLIAVALLAIGTASLATYFLFTSTSASDLQFSAVEMNQKLQGGGLVAGDYLSQVNMALEPDIDAGTVRVMARNGKLIFHLDAASVSDLEGKLTANTSRIVTRIAQLADPLYGAVHVTVQAGPTDKPALQAIVATLQGHLPADRAVIPIDLGAGARSTVIISVDALPKSGPARFRSIQSFL